MNAVVSVSVSTHEVLDPLLLSLKVAGLESVDGSLEHAARSLGASDGFKEF